MSLKQGITFAETVSITMEMDEAGHDLINRFFCPFPPHSVNVVTASTNSGKSTLISQFLKNKENCFVRNFNKAIIVLCNEKVNVNIYEQLQSDELEIQIVYINEFIAEEYLSENIVLIFEDVYQLNEQITSSINVYAHHLDLCSVFLVTQSILKEEEFKTLLSLSHRLIVFFNGVQASKLVQYVSKQFFVNKDIKNYLKFISSYAEKQKSVVLFELNDINGIYTTKYFAIVNFNSFINKRVKHPTIIFPKMNEVEDYNEAFSDYQASLPDIDNLPENSFILVPVKNVTKKSDPKSIKKLNSHEEQWNQTNQSILDDIQFSIKFINQQPARNIAKSILNSKYFNISMDGKSFNIKDNPKSVTSLLDYLNVASRRAFPGETCFPLYFYITKLLVQSKTPRFFFRNKSLFVAPKKLKSLLKK